MTKEYLFIVYKVINKLKKDRIKRDKLKKDKLKRDILIRDGIKKDILESEIRKVEMRTKIEKLEIIAEEAAKIRRRFFENSKVFYKNGSWAKVRGWPGKLAIEAGNEPTELSLCFQAILLVNENLKIVNF